MRHELGNGFFYYFIVFTNLTKKTSFGSIQLTRLVIFWLDQRIQFILCVYDTLCCPGFHLKAGMTTKGTLRKNRACTCMCILQIRPTITLKAHRFRYIKHNIRPHSNLQKLIAQASCYNIICNFTTACLNCFSNLIKQPINFKYISVTRAHFASRKLYCSCWNIDSHIVKLWKTQLCCFNNTLKVVFLLFRGYNITLSWMIVLVLELHQTKIARAIQTKSPACYKRIVETSVFTTRKN